MARMASFDLAKLSTPLVECHPTGSPWITNHQPRGLHWILTAQVKIWVPKKWEASMLSGKSLKMTRQVVYSVYSPKGAWNHFWSRITSSKSIPTDFKAIKGPSGDVWSESAAISARILRKSLHHFWCGKVVHWWVHLLKIGVLDCTRSSNCVKQMSILRHKISACLLETDSESMSAPARLTASRRWTLAGRLATVGRCVGQPWLVTGLISGELVAANHGFLPSKSMCFRKKGELSTDCWSYMQDHATCSNWNKSAYWSLTSQVLR